MKINILRDEDEDNTYYCLHDVPDVFAKKYMDGFIFCIKANSYGKIPPLYRSSYHTFGNRVLDEHWGWSDNTASYPRIPYDYLGWWDMCGVDDIITNFKTITFVYNSNYNLMQKISRS